MNAKNPGANDQLHDPLTHGASPQPQAVDKNKGSRTGHKAPLLLPVGIQARLLLLIALTLLPAILLIVWIYEQQYSIQRAEALQTEVEVSRGVSAALSAYFEAIQHQNYALGQAITTSTFTNAEINQLFSSTVAEFPPIRAINWVDPTGAVLDSNMPIMVGQNLSGLPYFQQILNGQDWVVGDLTRSGIASNIPSMSIATAIRSDDGALEGTIVANIDPNLLGELVLTEDRPARGSISIFDRQGVLVYSSMEQSLTWDERVNWKTSDSILQRVLATGQEQSGIIPYDSAAELWAVARAPIAEIGWVVGARRPESDVLSPVRLNLAQNAAIAAIVVLIALSLSALFARTISRPIHRLENDAQAMGDGTIPPHDDSQAPVEVHNLRKTIETMASTLIQRAEALRESEERFRVLFHNRHSPMMLVDPETTNILDVNPAATAFYGWTREEMLQMCIPQINTLPADQIKEKMQQAMSSTTSMPFTFQHRLASEEIRDVEVRSAGILIAEKRYLFSIITDITERRQAEATLQSALTRAEEGRQLLEALMEYVPEGITIAYGREANIRMVSRYGQEKLGAPHQDRTAEQVANEWTVYASDGETVLPVEELPVIRAIHKGEVVNNQAIVQINTAGQKLPLLCSAGPIRDAAGAVVGGVVAWRDVTDQQKAEEAVRRSEAQLRVIFENVNEGIVVSDLNGTLTYWNRSALEMHEFASLEEVCLNVADFQNLFEFSDEEGKIWPMDEWPVSRILRGEQIINLEARVRRLDKKWQRVLSYSGTLVRDLDGRPYVAVVTISDITERKHAEEILREYTQRLERSNQELQDFAFIASHDLQEPLRKIEAFGDWILNDGTSLGEEQRDHLQRMRTAAGRMRRMITDLLDLSRVSTKGQPFETVDLGLVVQDVLSDLEVQITTTHASLEVGALPVIQADPFQMRQLLQNLVGNALKYHHPNLPPIVKITGRQKSPTQVEIRVEDQGIGFDERYKDRIFQPFQRLISKSEYEGSGMGLAICRKIVERHHGKITVKSKIGEGSVFIVQLPTAPSPDLL